MIWDIAGIIVLTLLKILGIILLILLVLLLLVFLVPIRYRVRAVFGEEQEVRASVSWLWFLVRLPIYWQDGQVRWKLRIMGIPFFQSEKRGSRSQRHGSGRNSKRHSKRVKAEKQTVSSEEKAKEDRQLTVDDISIEKNGKDDKRREKEENAVHSYGEETDRAEKSSVQGERERDADQRENTKNPSRDGYKPSEDAQNKKKHKKHSPCRRLWHKICEIYQAVCDMIRNIRRKVHSVQDLIQLLQKDSSRRFICIAKENMLQLWRHLKPQKIQGEIRFGTGDPCSTGQILGGIAVFYSWLGTGVHITPDFEEACFEGRLKGKGRIRVLTMVIILIRLIRNKDFRKLQREWRQWKEDF